MDPARLPDPPAMGAEELRALLRDVLCGHLEPDLRVLADSIVAQDGAAPRQQQTVA